MRGGMVGIVVDEKENTPERGTGKNGKERRRRSSAGGSGRRFSISGSKPRLHYLRVTNRFQRKGGNGRGRITAHRPVHLDGSPYEYTLRSESDGERRKSFVVYEDENSFTFKSDSKGKVAGSDYSTGENCRTPKPQNTEEQIASTDHVLENFVAFRARNNSMFSAKLRPRPVTPLMEPVNQQRPSLKNLAARWQRDGRRSLFTQRFLDTSELEDLELTFRKMDEEDLEREMQENDLELKKLKHALEWETHKFDLEREMHEFDLSESRREYEELEKAVKFIEPASETVMVPMEEQANFAEPYDSRDLVLLSPRTGGPQSEEESAHVDLTTPLPNDFKEEAPFSNATPVILELGVSPEANDTDRAIKQVTPSVIKQATPPASLTFLGSNNQDGDNLPQINVEVELEISQTVEAVQVWSVELDPSRRRREEEMQGYSNRRSPWIKTLHLSSFQSANQSSDAAGDVLLQTSAMSMDHFDRFTPSNVSGSLSPIRSSEFALPAKNLVESFEGGFLPAILPSSSGEEGDVERIDSRFLICPDHAVSNEVEANVPLLNEQPLEDSETIPSNRRSSGLDKSPVPLIDSPVQCMGGIHEKNSESSPEPPFSQSPEPLRGVDEVTDTPTLIHAPFGTPRVSPTPPRDLSVLFGNPFGQMSGEELTRRWLQFCTTPPVFSNTTAGKKRSWTVESAFAEPTCSGPTTSFPSEQVLERTTEAEVLPIAEEEAVSSDGCDGKTSTHDDNELTNAEEEALSSDGSDGVMDYENDFDDISNDTTCIVQTGASSAENDQEGTSALKECAQEDAQDAITGEDMRCINLTPLRDTPSVEVTAGPAVEYSLTHVDEEHIDQFMSSLQVTPGMDDSCADRPTSNGEGGVGYSPVNQNSQTPGDKTRQLNLNKELTTPEKDGNELPGQPQNDSTPVQQKPKTKRTRKSTRSKKVDSPLDAGSKWANGQRISTRIKSKPLDWWRGERMLYGRVHSTLNTLIGIKHLSPDPVWPRPRDRKNKVEPPKFKVDSFVTEEHNELLRLAAQ